MLLRLPEWECQDSIVLLRHTLSMGLWRLIWMGSMPLRSMEARICLATGPDFFTTRNPLPDSSGVNSAACTRLNTSQGCLVLPLSDVDQAPRDDGLTDLFHHVPRLLLDWKSAIARLTKRHGDVACTQHNPA